MEIGGDGKYRASVNACLRVDAKSDIKLMDVMCGLSRVEEYILTYVSDNTPAIAGGHRGVICN